MPSRPDSSGHGESDSTQAVAVSSAADRVELTAIGLALLPLRLDDRGRRLPAEALVGEDVLGAGDLLLQALDLRPGVAVRLYPGGFHHRFEDAEVVALERGPNAAPPEDRRRLLDAVERP